MECPHSAAAVRDGLRPPLTAAARSGQRKLGWDEEMVAVRSNKEMVKNSSLDTNRPMQVTDRAMEAWYHPSIAGVPCALPRQSAPDKTRDKYPGCLDFPTHPAILPRSAPDKNCGAKRCRCAVGGPAWGRS